ncbi:MAG TPA: GNAT family N-acetyltransferase [Anaerolineales bacterium]|nr:GNAT family N-acetyltransferase [Anaerolineales bacterium]
MIRSSAPPRTRELLGTDRIWSAYALADLEPEEQGLAEWRTGEQAVVLLYRGLEPPVFFVHGAPSEAATLAQGLGPLRVVYNLRPESMAALAHRLDVESDSLMWRMWLQRGGLQDLDAKGLAQLGPEDLRDILSLFGEHVDRPDAFHPRQLERGVFFGLFERGELVGVAGTHILAPGSHIAAVGNVFTRPDARGRGIGGRATSAVVNELLRQGYSTIVLNVAETNEPAIRCYRRLGFTVHCAYHEGLGRLGTESEQRGDLHG